MQCMSELQRENQSVQIREIYLQSEDARLLIKRPGQCLFRQEF